MILIPRWCIPRSKVIFKKVCALTTTEQDPKILYSHFIIEIAPSNRGKHHSGRPTGEYTMQPRKTPSYQGIHQCLVGGGVGNWGGIGSYLLDQPARISQPASQPARTCLLGGLIPPFCNIQAIFWPHFGTLRRHGNGRKATWRIDMK